MITARLGRPPRALAVVATLVAALSLAACSSADSTSAPDVNAKDTWVKTADEGGMAGAFGIVENGGSEDVTIISASSPVAGMVELHETVAEDGGMVMQEKPGGFAVPAGGSLTFEPGADHIMLMKLLSPVAPGDDVAITLTFSDGTTLTFHAIAKDFAGANETYVGDTADQ